MSYGTGYVPPWLGSKGGAAQRDSPHHLDDTIDGDQ